jgi:hypothetical protein
MMLIESSELMMLIEFAPLILAPPACWRFSYFSQWQSTSKQKDHPKAVSITSRESATLALILIGALMVAHSERRKLVAVKTQAAPVQSN